MWRVFVKSGQYACIDGVDNAFDAVAVALSNPLIRSRKVMAVTFGEDPTEIQARLHFDCTDGSAEDPVQPERMRA